MIWTAFEIAINCFQGFLILLYVKQCFSYTKPHRIADGLLFTSFAGFLSLFLFFDMPSSIDLLLWGLPAIYALSLSAEPKGVVVYWLLILVTVFNLISALTYPLFDMLPQLLHFSFPAQWLEMAIRMIVTNIILLVFILWIIRLKRSCPTVRLTTYAAFILSLIAIFVIEESLYALYGNYGKELAFALFIGYVSLTACTVLSIFLFQTVSSDSDRENQYQAQISMLNLSRQYQSELTQMYAELTERQHDYKHHLQALEQLVGNNESATAREYLSSIAGEYNLDDTIITGSLEVDALLTAKRRNMRAQGIEFDYSPYPLKDLPIAVADFCSIVGNLLDNAIEGIGRIAEPMSAKYIRLTFSRSWNMFYIYCENPCNPSTIVKRRGRFISSKQSSERGLHGIGLSSIIAIVARAEGRTEFTVEDGVFYAKVVLPYLESKK